MNPGGGVRERMFAQEDEIEIVDEVSGDASRPSTSRRLERGNRSQNRGEAGLNFDRE